MNRVFSLILIFLASFSLFAQSDGTMQYSRSSLYPILLTHPEVKYSDEILKEYSNLEIPDKFDDHRLSVKSIEAEHKKTSSDEILVFLNESAVGRRMVAKWFNRDQSGNFNTDLVMQRGNYDASIIDVDIAQETVRGNDLLLDAGDKLIKNTFVLVHDITYIDKEKGARIATGILATIAAVAGVVESVNDYDDDDDGANAAGAVKSLAFLGASISSLISGFTVKTTSHLYQLEWNDDILNAFYELYWCDGSTSSDIRRERKRGFENEMELFKLSYVGSYVARSQKTVLRGLHNNGDVIRKVCARALDKNIAMLQKRYDCFKVNTPILAVNGDNIIVPIGMKEEVDRKSKFEVLEALQDENGLTRYRRVGVVKPVDNMIWDNRYMAAEEEALGAALKGTTFRVVSGNKFYPGMLIKEIK